MRSRETNRHGIPLRGGDSRKCSWPQCPSPVGMYPDIPLCSAHAVTVQLVVTRTDAEAARVRQDNVERLIRANGGTPIQPKPKQTHIYYIKVGGHIKIGYTARLEERMRQFPPNSELLAVHPGTRADEQLLHKRFAVHRSHGREWYPLHPVVLDHIDRMIQEHGKPDRVDFGARPVKVPQARDKQPVRVKSRTARRHLRAGQFS